MPRLNLSDEDIHCISAAGDAVGLTSVTTDSAPQPVQVASLERVVRALSEDARTDLLAIVLTKGVQDNFVPKRKEATEYRAEDAIARICGFAALLSAYLKPWLGGSQL